MNKPNGIALRDYHIKISGHINFDKGDTITESNSIKYYIIVENFNENYNKGKIGTYFGLYIKNFVKANFINNYILDNGATSR